MALCVMCIFVAASPARAADDEATFRTNHFEITYSTDPSSSNAPDLADADNDGVADVVERLGGAFENARAVEVDALGYRTPPNEGLYPVYVGGSLSLTQPLGDPSSPSRPSFTTITPAILRSSTPDEVLLATAAHEYFHAIQNAYDWSAPQWVKEGSADWMETLVTGDPTVAGIELRSVVPFPRLSIETIGGGHEYGAWIFFQFLTERYGSNDVVKDIWEQLNVAFAATDAATVDTLDTTLSARGSSFADAWATFLVWELRISHFSHGAEYRAALAGTQWPAIDRDDKIATDSCALSADTSSPLSPLAGEYVRLHPAKKAPAHGDAVVSVEGSPSASGEYVRISSDGSAEEHQLTFDERGVAQTVLPFGRNETKRLTLVLANPSATAEASFRYSLRYADASGVTASNPEGPSTVTYGTGGQFGGTVTCNGAPAPEADLDVRVTDATGDTEVFPVTTDGDGHWVQHVSPPTDAYVDVVVADPLLAPVRSASAPVEVRLLVAVEPRIDTVTQGQPTSIAGSIDPEHPTIPLQLEYRRPQGDWRTGPETRSDASSGFSFSYVFPGDGVWEVRVRALSTGDADHLPGVSSTRFVYVDPP